MPKPELTKYQLTEIEIRVLNHLEVGHSQAKSRKELVKLTQISDRKIRLAIEQLRREGYAILTNPIAPFGYFFAQDRKELDEYIKTERNRLVNGYRTFKAVKRASITRIGHEFGQIPMMLGVK